MLRILNAEPDRYDAEARATLGTLGAVFDDRTLSRKELLDSLANIDILIIRLGHRVDREMIDAAPELKAVVSATTGVDHLDLNAIQERCIDALTLRGETEFLRTITATAEQTWALLLALRRKLIPAAKMGASGEWDREQMRGHEMRGSTLGIVGYGRLGSMVARYGKAFEMTVLAYDPYVLIDGTVEAVGTLEELCDRSDVISLHVPLNEETTHLFDSDLFAHCRPGAVLINTARGAVVDSSALLDALQSGKLVGAALDVVEGELIAASLHDHPLLAYARAHDNLIITPHIGGATFESMARTERFMARKLANHCRRRGWVPEPRETE
ncbi:MAG: hydroxyacid dehydrogenase [Anaerolineae bacterium]|nr:hydroxyacid dehydrogenase [Anaerolineae bacterium]